MKLCDFREKVVVQILVQNGFDKDKLIIKFLKFANKYPEILSSSIFSTEKTF